MNDVQIKMQFCPKVAKALDVNCAIMFSNISFWVAKNEANESERHFFEGKYWTYNSRKAFTKLFTFWSEPQIKRILAKLEKAGYIEKKQMEGGGVNWYSIACPKKPKGRATSSTNIYTDNKPDNKPVSKETEAKAYGGEDINWVLEEFEKINGFKSAGTKTKDRWMAKHLLNNYTREQISYMMVYCASEKYSPTVGSVEKLWHKRGEVIAGIRKKTTENNNKIAIIN